TRRPRRKRPNRAGNAVPRRNCPTGLLAWAKARSGACHAGYPRGLGARGALAAPVPARRGRVSLAGWRVPVLAFGPASALALLCEPGWGGSGPPGDAAMAGGSLTYLAAVARFAAGLAVRGRVLPVLEAEGDAYTARWWPV